VSSTTQVAVLASLREGTAPSRRVAAPVERPLIRIASFAALGLYGVVRWGTMMSPGPTGRLLALLGLALVLAAAGPVLRRYDRAIELPGGRVGLVALVGVPLAVLAVLAAFPISGVPWHWVHHLRIAVTADGIGQGLSALPGVLVPYNGINQWVNTVILLGAAVLLLDAGLLLAFAPATLGDVRRAGAALPLIALVIVPATLVRPQLAYLQGVLLFALIALFMWGERVPPDRRGAVLVACALAGAAGMVLAPALDQHSPWIDYEALTRGLTPAHVESFNWTQSYGPLNWPRTGTAVLEVNATPSVFPGEYWKAEDLNAFDGRGWINGDLGLGDDTATVTAKTIRKYTQNLKVTIRAMSTTQVIAAGSAMVAPTHLSQQVLQGSSLGTWQTVSPLGPGDSYDVQVYTPHPTPAQLARTGAGYPATLADAYLQLAVPETSLPIEAAEQQVLFPGFGTRYAPVDETDQVNFTGTSAVEHSPYAPVYALARRLKGGTTTPYGYVKAVMGYLDNGRFQYDENPPVTEYPLVTFLTSEKIGYCQQFAGSMALLLRMGGVPARVVTGFTTGSYDSATKQLVVTDINAHAWVEVWFPHYGWVSFDPTPASAPARGGRSPSQSAAGLGQTGNLGQLTRRPETPASTASGGGTVAKGGSSFDTVALAVAAALALALLIGYAVWRRVSPQGPEAMLAELERAMHRTGRPVADGVTLVALERRFRTSPDAADYVRVIRLARYGDQTKRPTLAQRRALRAQLRAGLGFAGAVRALWALPPRPERHRKHPGA
jgi:protein-glutamine gamma-glutamyltransferase